MLVLTPVITPLTSLMLNRSLTPNVARRKDSRLFSPVSASLAAT